jgi:tight adherence protein C
MSFSVIELMRVAVLGSAAACFAALGYAAARLPLPPRPILGERGRARNRALACSSGFSSIEPAMRFFAAVQANVARLPLLRRAATTLEDAQARSLRASGDYLGLDPNELSGLCALFALGGAALGLALSLKLDSSTLGLPLGAAFGGALPYFQLSRVVQRRKKDVARGLPPAIDLLSMCVGAGLDFPGALRLITRDRPAEDTLAQELRGISRSLELGHTRVQALGEFEVRLPIDPVRDFCRALIQAEEKGTPIAKALNIQAEVSRLHRSVAAEEAATRAGVMMLLPTMLLLGCILLLMLGPFMVGGLGM